MVLVAFLPRELPQVGAEEDPSCSELPAKLPFGSHPQVLYVLLVIRHSVTQTSPAGVIHACIGVLASLPFRKFNFRFALYIP